MTQFFGNRHWWRDLVGVGLLLVPLLAYSDRSFQRPPQTPTMQPLFQGIIYERSFRRMPQPIMLHIVTIDLMAPGIQVLVTPASPKFANQATAARTTSQFVQEFDVQLAVNASFFFPFREDAPWDFYPHSGDRTIPVGLAISNGNSYTSPQAGWAVLCFAANHTAQILASGICPAQTQQAVAGSGVIVANGQPKISDAAGDRAYNYSRTVVALDKAGTKLWLILVDDKQPTYSEGITLDAIANIATHLGADSAINLDGGGSTTLVATINRKPTVLNAPIHTKVPMRERVVANHLGFRAQPLVK